MQETLTTVSVHESGSDTSTIPTPPTLQERYRRKKK